MGSSAGVGQYSRLPGRHMFSMGVYQYRNAVLTAYTSVTLSVRLYVRLHERTGTGVTGQMSTLPKLHTHSNTMEAQRSTYGNYTE